MEYLGRYKVSIDLNPTYFLTADGIKVGASQSQDAGATFALYSTDPGLVFQHVAPENGGLVGGMIALQDLGSDMAQGVFSAEKAMTVFRQGALDGLMHFIELTRQRLLVMRGDTPWGIVFWTPPQMEFLPCWRVHEVKAWNKESMTNADLRYTSLRHLRLGNIDLTGADLRAANFDSSTFSEAKLQKVKTNERTSFARTTFSKCDFTGADLKQAHFEEATLSECTFGKMELKLAKFVGSSFQPAKLNGSKLESATFDGNDLTGVDFTGAHLKGASFRKCNLTNAIFTGADLQEAHFDDATANGAQFPNAKMGGATLTNAKLAGANLAKADLAAATLAGATFDGSTDFSEATLIGTAFSGCDLTKAKFGTLPRKFYDDKTDKAVPLDRTTIPIALIGTTDWSWLNLDGATINGTLPEDLTGFKACHSVFPEDYDISSRRFDNADFSYARMHKVVLNTSKCDAQKPVKFIAADLEEAKFYGVELPGADFSEATLCGITLSKSKLAAAKFKTAKLHTKGTLVADLSSCYLRDADFTQASLGSTSEALGANFSYVMLFGTAKLDNATMPRAQFAGAFLLNVSFQNIDHKSMASVVFTGACLVNCNFQGTSLAGASLNQAALQGADLTDASLAGAKMAEAALAKEKGTLKLVNLPFPMTEAKFDLPTNIKNVITDTSTVCPNGPGKCDTDEKWYSTKGPVTTWSYGSKAWVGVTFEEE